jgi:light-regulated signal transduction histidine kinase (bacteriophytochrome)
MNNAEGESAVDILNFLDTGLNPSLIVAAHELKAPLVLLRQLTFQFEEENFRAPNQKLSKKNSEITRRIRLTTERTLRLVDNLTKAARLEDALFELEPIQLTG